MCVCVCKPMVRVCVSACKWTRVHVLHRAASLSSAHSTVPQRRGDKVEVSLDCLLPPFLFPPLSAMPSSGLFQQDVISGPVQSI